MSDFLSNLAVRTLAQPSLRPRPTSRFESLQRGEAVAPAEENEFVRVTAPPARREIRKAAPVEPVEERVMSVPAPPLREPPPRLTAAEPEVAPLPRRRARRAEVEPPRETPASSEPPRVERSREIPAPRRIEANERAPERRDPPRIERTSERPRVAAPPPAVNQRNAPPAIETIVKPGRTTHVVEKQIETVVETRERRVPVSQPSGTPHQVTVLRDRHDEVPPVIAERRDVQERREGERPTSYRDERIVTSRRATRTLAILGTPPPPSAPPPPAEPEIHVSIGRVEVRATTAPPATRRRTEGPRTMTIDDYLARRAKKERG